LGGGGDNVEDAGAAIVVDASGNTFVTGSTVSPIFPTVNPLQATFSGGDAFIVKLSDSPPAEISAVFESPEHNHPVSGIGVIRGWAFARQSGVQISKVEVIVDNEPINVPCCSERGDVLAAFPQFPAANTLNSSWGLLFNWGTLSAGAHTIRVEIRNTVGEVLRTEIRTVTVFKPGDFEFLDRFDLSQATVEISGVDSIVLKRVVVRDKVTQQQREIEALFSFFENSQSLGLFSVSTTAELSSWRSPLSALLATLSTHLWGGSGVVASAQAALGLRANFESPEEAQVAAGIGLFRGWAFSEDEQASIPQVRLLIDGAVAGTVSCCSEREDVLTAFPQFPATNTLNSGWGLLFNYGALSAGVHTASVQIQDTSGAVQTLNRTFRTVQIGGFEFVDQFDLSGATAQIEGQEIVLSNVQVRDKTSQQTKVIDVRLCWLQNSQSLEIIASSS
jgi:hypothetical protein